MTKTYPKPEYDRKEILRYAGCSGSDVPKEMTELMEQCIKECEDAGAFSYKIAYRFLPVSFYEETDAEGKLAKNMDFGPIKVTSGDLYKNLSGCTECIFLAATVGSGIDRLIGKYSRLNPAKALFLQAIGAERVESLCDTFCTDEKIFPESIEYEGCSLRPRFSPGYGDLSLKIQRDFLNVLEANKRLGITLGESLLMSPSKSVTAIAGVNLCGGNQT